MAPVFRQEGCAQSRCRGARPSASSWSRPLRSSGSTTGMSSASTPPTAAVSRSKICSCRRAIRSTATTCARCKSPARSTSLPLNGFFSVGFSAVALGIARAMLEAPRLRSQWRRRRAWPRRPCSKTTTLNSRSARRRQGCARPACIRRGDGWQASRRAVIASGELAIAQRMDMRRGRRLSPFTRPRPSPTPRRDVARCDRDLRLGSLRAAHARSAHASATGPRPQSAPAGYRRLPPRGSMPTWRSPEAEPVA